MFDDVDDSVIKSAEDLKAGTITMDGFKKSAQSASSATAKFGATLKSVAANIGIILAVNLAIKAVSAVADQLIVTIDEQREKVDELVASYEGLKSEYETLSQKQELTDAENQRLNYLERRLELDQKVLEAETRLLKLKEMGRGSWWDDLTSLFDSDSIQNQTFKEFGYDSSQMNGFTSFLMDILGVSNFVSGGFNLASFSDGFDNTIRQGENWIYAFEKIQNEIENIDNVDISEIINSWGSMDNYKEYLSTTSKDIEEELNKFYDDLVTKEGSYLEKVDFYKDSLATGLVGEDKEYAEEQLSLWQNSYEALQKQRIEIELLLGKINEFKALESRSYFNKDDVDYLLSLSEEGYNIGFIENVLRSDFRELNSYLKEYGISVEEFLNHYKEVVAEQEELGDSISYSSLTEQYDSASDSAKSLHSSITSLTKAFDEQNTSNSISVDTMLDLVENGYATAISYDEATKSYVLNKEAVLDLLRAKIEEQKITIQRTQSELVNALDAEIDGLKRTTEGYYDLLEAKKLNLTTDQLLAMEQYNNLEAQKKALEDVYANWDKIVGGTYGSSSSSSKSPTETALDKAKEQFDAITTLYKSQYQAIDYTVNLINDKLEEVEINDQIAGESFYSALIEQENKRLEVLISEYQDKIEEFDNAVTSGIVKEGSDAWVSMQSDIDGVCEAIQAVNNQILKYEKSMKEIVKLKFDKLNEQFDNSLSLITSEISQMEKQLAIVEEAGYNAGKSFYESMADAQIENVKGLVQQYEQLSATLSEGLADGSIQQFDDNWYEMYSDITEVENALLDAQKALLEYQTALRELDWDAFDRGQEYIGNLLGESNFLADLYGLKNLYNDNGTLTNEGLTVQGLHVANYEIYKAQAQDYADEMEEINKQLADDPYNQVLIDRYNELNESRMDAIKSMEDERDAVLDLKKNGYDELLDTFDKLISAQKDTLNSASDLRSYENTIADQTASIEMYRKQLMAYSGDDSEEMRSIIQKTTESLAQAERDLQETQYEKYIADQNAMLDNFQNELQEWVNIRLDNVDKTFDEAVAETNRNNETIARTILGDEYISKIGESFFGDGDGSFSSVSENVQGLLDSIKTFSENMVSETDDVGNILTQKLPELMEAIPTMGETNEKLVDIKGAIDLVKSALETINVTIAQLNLGGGSHTSSYTPTGGGNNGITSEESVKKKQESWQAPESQDIYDINTGKKIGTTSGDATQFEIDKLANSYNIDPVNTTDVKVDKYRIVDTRDGSVIETGYTEEPSTNYLNEVADRHGIDAVYLDVEKYAKGVHRLKDDEIAWTQENGTEAILSPSRNAILTPLKAEDTVLTAAKTENLFDWAQINPMDMTRMWNVRTTPSVPMVDRNVVNNTPVNVEVAFNIPNVTNTDELIRFVQTDRRFEKIIHTSVSDAILGRGSYGKYKY